MSGGAHPLLAAGQLRRGWWALAAGNYAQSVSAFRERLALSSAPGPVRAGQPSETDWAEAGLALASLGAGNVEGARTGVKALQSRRSPLATPVMLRLARAARCACHHEPCSHSRRRCAQREFPEREAPEVLA